MELNQKLFDNDLIESLAKEMALHTSLKKNSLQRTKELDFSNDNLFKINEKKIRNSKSFIHSPQLNQTMLIKKQGKATFYEKSIQIKENKEKRLEYLRQKKIIAETYTFSPEINEKSVKMLAGKVEREDPFYLRVDKVLQQKELKKKQLKEEIKSKEVTIMRINQNRFERRKFEEWVKKQEEWEYTIKNRNQSMKKFEERVENESILSIKHIPKINIRSREIVFEEVCYERLHKSNIKTKEKIKNLEEKLKPSFKPNLEKWKKAKNNETYLMGKSKSPIRPISRNLLKSNSITSKSISISPNRTYNEFKVLERNKPILRNNFYDSKLKNEMDLVSLDLKEESKLTHYNGLQNYKTDWKNKLNHSGLKSFIGSTHEYY